MRTRLSAGALLMLLGACSGDVEGAGRPPNPVPSTDGLDAHATMARGEFEQAVQGQLDEFDRMFRAFESRVVLAGDKAKAEAKAAVQSLPPLRDAAVAEFTRFQEAADTATTEQRKEIVEFCRRLHRALREAIAKEG